MVTSLCLYRCTGLSDAATGQVNGGYDAIDHMLVCVCTVQLAHIPYAC